MPAQTLTSFLTRAPWVKTVSIQWYSLTTEDVDALWEILQGFQSVDLTIGPAAVALFWERLRNSRLIEPAKFILQTEVFLQTEYVSLQGKGMGSLSTAEYTTVLNETFSWEELEEWSFCMYPFSRGSMFRLCTRMLSVTPLIPVSRLDACVQSLDELESLCSYLPMTTTLRDLRLEFRANSAALEPGKDALMAALKRNGSIVRVGFHTFKALPEPFFSPQELDKIAAFGQRNTHLGRMMQQEPKEMVPTLLRAANQTPRMALGTGVIGLLGLDSKEE